MSTSVATSTAVERFISDTVRKFADGVTLAEVAEQFRAFTTLCVQLAAQSLSDGPDKKAWVMLQVARLYDAVAGYIPLPFPLSLFAPFIRSALRDVVLAISSSAIEEIYARLKPSLPVA